MKTHSFLLCIFSLQLCETALSHGYLPAVFNRRSHNGTPLTTLKLQQFGDPADLREAVRYIRYRQPAGRLYAVSESTGSGLLLSYLGECGSSSYVTAAVCLSPVFRCQSWFENGLSWPLQWALVLYQKMCLSRYGGRVTSCVQCAFRLLSKWPTHKDFGFVTEVKREIDFCMQPQSRVQIILKFSRIVR